MASRTTATLKRSSDTDTRTAAPHPDDAIPPSPFGDTPRGGDPDVLIGRIAPVPRSARHVAGTTLSTCAAASSVAPHETGSKATARARAGPLLNVP